MNESHDARQRQMERIYIIIIVVAHHHDHIYMNQSVKSANVIIYFYRFLFILIYSISRQRNFAYDFYKRNKTKKKQISYYLVRRLNYIKLLDLFYFRKANVKIFETDERQF